MTVFLTCDTYKIECLNTVDISRPYDGTNGFHAFSAGFGYSSNTGTTSYKSLYPANMCIYTKPLAASESLINPVFSVPSDKQMVFSAWVKESCTNPVGGISCSDSIYVNNKVVMTYAGSSQRDTLFPSGPIVEGWQRYEGYFTPPSSATQMTLNLVNLNNQASYFDDIRIHPFNANMKSYVYDPINLRLTGELDENNYARFYEYDEEGTLIRTKAETSEGVKTINETRSFKQRKINQIQQ